MQFALLIKALMARSIPQPTSFKNERLQQAAFEGREAAIAYWLSRGADVNARCGHGITPVMRAAGYGNQACLRLLMAAGADLLALDSEGERALDFANRPWSKNSRDETFGWLRDATLAQEQQRELADLAAAPALEAPASQSPRARPRI